MHIRAFSDRAIKFQAWAGRLSNSHAVPNRWDITFCVLLTIIATAIFFIAKSWSVPVLSNVVAFDGKYYLDVAKHGYHFSGLIQERQNISYFPLESLAIALSRWLLPGQNDFLKIALLGSATLLGTLSGFFFLLGEREGKQAARLSALLWTFSPLAFYHFVGYAEPLFALGTVWCLVALRRGWLGTASVIAGISMLGRPQAIVLVLFTAVEILRNAGWRPWRLAGIGTMLKLAMLAAPLMVFASWMALAFHDSIIYVNAGAAWRHYYNSAGNFLPFFQSIGFFMHGISAESSVLTDWKVMLGCTSMVIAAMTIMLSTAASRREVLMYFAFFAFFALVVSFDLSNFSRHTLYLAPWAIICGTALANLPGREWRKWVALVPFVAFCVLINVYAVMRFYRWEWVS